ncbi:unnamed protein product, partial [Mesorhabditis belari]|uniref:G-protein coupled receptors family 1 profile domain-containing protein n=1 Tax=Mesorhabditis belari TaxID=2138241 RepID=A0AAF3ETL7_9BILA
MDLLNNVSTNETDECEKELQMDDVYKLGLVFAYGVVGILSLFGNAIVLLMVVCRREMRTATNIFISSVSAADLVITLFSLWATPFSYYQRTWLFGEGMCYFVYMIQGASLMWAPLALAAIAVDRYMLVANPFRKQLSPLNCLLIICSVWAAGFVILSPMMTHLSYVEFELPCDKAYCIEYWKPREYRLFYGIFVFLVHSFIPLIIISWCHYRIASILSSQNSKLQKNRSKSTYGVALDISRKQRLQKLLLAMVLIFAVSSLPMDVFNVYQDIELIHNFRWLSEDVSHMLFYFSHLLAMAGTLLNPLVYAWWNENFRRQIKSIFKELRGIREPPFKTSIYEKQSRFSLRNPEALTAEQQIVLQCADGEDPSNDVQI